MKEFYKGYTLLPILRQGDKSLFARTIGWRGYYGLTLVGESVSKTDLKKFLRENPPSKLRKEGIIS